MSLFRTIYSIIMDDMQVTASMAEDMPVMHDSDNSRINRIMGRTKISNYNAKIIMKNKLFIHPMDIIVLHTNVDINLCC